MGVIRIQFSTRKCIAFLSGRREEDIKDVRSRCLLNSDLLKTHPFYLLCFIYEHRYERWTDWFADLWRDIAEIETLTNMTHPRWKLQGIDTKRLQSLSRADTLLGQLYATNIELCHSHTVMSFALKFGKFCFNVLDEAEKRRQDLGLRPLPMRYRSDLEESLKSTTVRFESMADRLSELKDRLMGQINVVCSFPHLLHAIR
jgi:hypothetical protein